MKIWLENIQCWETEGGFKASLDKTPSIDLTELGTSGKPAEIQIGPYRINIEIMSDIDSDTGEVKVGLKIAGRKLNINLKHGHGKLFMYSSEVDLLSPQDPSNVFGKAHGCFDLLW